MTTVSGAAGVEAGRYRTSVDVLAPDVTKIIFLSSDRPALTSNSSSRSSKINSLAAAPTVWRKTLSERLDTASSVV